MLLHRFRERTEDHACFGELVLEGGRDGNAVKNGINRDSRQHLLFLQRNAELFISTKNLGIKLIEALELLLLLRRRVVRDSLIINGPVLDVRPSRFGGSLLL